MLSDDQTQIDQSPPMLSDDQTLHAAVCILRKDIGVMDLSNTYYPTSGEVSLSYSMQLMPSSLTKFLYWLIDNKSHSEAEIGITPCLEKMRKYLAIAETIVFLSKNSFTPFHIGLAIQLYNEYGSKLLLDTLYSHGFCASYDEVRRYITSLANFEIDRFGNGVHVPYG